MPVLDMIRKVYAFFLRICGWLNFLPPLLTRLVIGFVFLVSGYGHLTHLDKVTDYFKSLGIPYPGLQAPFSSVVELVGGAFLMLGLFSRLSAAPLLVIMVVAVATAKSAYVTSIFTDPADKRLDNINDLFQLAEFLNILLLGWLVTHGPGWLSCDAILARSFGAKPKAEGEKKDKKKD